MEKLKSKLREIHWQGVMLAGMCVTLSGCFMHSTKYGSLNYAWFDVCSFGRPAFVYQHLEHRPYRANQVDYQKWLHGESVYRQQRLNTDYAAASVAPEGFVCPTGYENAAILDFRSSTPVQNQPLETEPQLLPRPETLNQPGVDHALPSQTLLPELPPAPPVSLSPKQKTSAVPMSQQDLPAATGSHVEQIITLQAPEL